VNALQAQWDALVQRVSSWYGSLPAREQLFVSRGAIAAAVLLVGGLAWQVHASVKATQARVERKQGDLAFILQNLTELQAASPTAAANGQPLVVLVDRTARDAGIAGQVAGTDPSGTNGLRVRLEGVDFDAMVRWLAVLQQQHGLSIQTASVERGGEPGRVQATLVLTRG
jgi:general secretion pathway protein M